MTILELSNWEFITSAQLGVTVVFFAGGGGYLQLKDTNTNNSFQINYGSAGVGLGVGLKAGSVLGKVQKAVVNLLSHLKGSGVSGSAAAFPNAGLIFKTPLAPKGDLPLSTFTDGLFTVFSGDATFGPGSGVSVFAWCPWGNPLFPPVAIGMFVGLQLGLVNLSITGSFGRVLSTELI